MNGPNYKMLGFTLEPKCGKHLHYYVKWSNCKSREAILFDFRFEVAKYTLCREDYFLLYLHQFLAFCGNCLTINHDFQCCSSWSYVLSEGDSNLWSTALCVNKKIISLCVNYQTTMQAFQIWAQKLKWQSKFFVFST